MTETWERVTSKGGAYVDILDRLRVPGGWLYRSCISDDRSRQIALVFVPTPKQPKPKKALAPGEYLIRDDPRQIPLFAAVEPDASNA